MESLIISRDLGQRIVNQLEKAPWGEVHAILVELHSAPSVTRVDTPEVEEDAEAVGG